LAPGRDSGGTAGRKGKSDMMHKSGSALLLGAALVVAGCQKQAATPGAAASPKATMSEDEKTIYALGAMIGQRFARPMHMSEAELEILKRGISDTGRGGEPEFPVGDYASKFEALAQSRAAQGAADEKQKASSFREKMEKEEGAVKTASGLIYKRLRPGTGASPKATDVVRVHYEGTLPDGKVFDSSIKRGEPAEFALNQVIPCWTEGVQMMKVGEKARLVCPSEIAYGDRGAGPDIPPGATLVFEVELLDIKGTK
jgi:FKBP-type peptidyl-prolyl cis-trans isomerase FkpA